MTELRVHETPILETLRLRLRPLRLEDAPAIARLAGRREIADTTISIPHPYSEAQAREWIAARSDRTAGNKEIAFAITIKESGQLVGSVGLREIDLEHAHAEMGFWIGVEWWARGYASEAAEAVLAYAFDQLNLNRIHAHHMIRNPASGRVMEKIGMKREGLLRQAVRKWGTYEDVALCAIVRADRR